MTAPGDRGPTQGRVGGGRGVVENSVAALLWTLGLQHIVNNCLAQWLLLWQENIGVHQSLLEPRLDCTGNNNNIWNKRDQNEIETDRVDCILYCKGTFSVFRTGMFKVKTVLLLTVRDNSDGRSSVACEQSQHLG